MDIYLVGKDLICEEPFREPACQVLQGIRGVNEVLVA